MKGSIETFWAAGFLRAVIGAGRADAVISRWLQGECWKTSRSFRAFIAPEVRLLEML